MRSGCRGGTIMPTRNFASSATTGLLLDSPTDMAEPLHRLRRSSKRWRERLYPKFRGPFKGKLAAMRFPEMAVVFDDGSDVGAPGG